MEKEEVMKGGQRYRITFAKTAAMRYTGHLDLHRTWERMIRRSQLPLAYTQGFSPHPRINLASALPLGFTGQAEVVDIWLEKTLPSAEVSAALRLFAPPGVEIGQVEAIDHHLPTLQMALLASDFEIILLEIVPELEQLRTKLLAAETLPRQRRNKPYDLRPLILTLDLIPADEAGLQRLVVRMLAREGATGRPEELLEAMGIDPLAARVQRTGLIFQA